MVFQWFTWAGCTHTVSLCPVTAGPKEKEANQEGLCSGSCPPSALADSASQPCLSLGVLISLRGVPETVWHWCPSRRLRV